MGIKGLETFMRKDADISQLIDIRREIGSWSLVFRFGCALR